MPKLFETLSPLSRILRALRKKIFFFLGQRNKYSTEYKYSSCTAVCGGNGGGEGLTFGSSDEG